MIALWSKLPVVVRALILGLTIQLAGVLSFGLLAQLNLQLAPAVPWSAAVELVLLWLLFSYLRGRGWPRATAEVRARRLRAVAVPRHLLPATVATGLALGASIILQMIFAYRLVEMPAAAGGALLAFLSAPPLTAIAILAAGVLMTAFVEEAAFRGYLQQPLEERHGPVLAILLVAVLFAAAHAPPLTVFPIFAVGSLGWGIYTRLARSTVPGMVVHGVVDAIAFAWIFTHPESLPDLLATSALDHGFDHLTIAAGLGAAVTAALTVAGFVWMARARRAESVDEGTQAPTVSPVTVPAPCERLS